MSVALTQHLDVAQVVLYAFWIFFAGLVFYLRREDRREGYPTEEDNPRIVHPTGPILIPPPKTYRTREGHLTTVPNANRDLREIGAQRTSPASGFPLQPVGNPMLCNAGPASYAQREDAPERTREGHLAIVPMRVARDFSVDAGPDPRGWAVVAADGQVAGKVTDIWVDRADALVRYLEVELSAGGRRLLPITMARLASDPRQVRVHALGSSHFGSVPALKNPDQVTLLEEEKIGAYYAAGRLYAEPRRLGPVL
ncbi:MAG TPA: photosynthetic reaction center subunit H [Myxococcaceae bacterium]|nr:photosynthetic reaction center subunit H [Myxococcaceae bacterium]